LLTRQVLAKAPAPERVAEMTWLLGYTLMRLRRYDEAIAAVRQALAGSALGAVGRARMCALEALVLANWGLYEDAAAATRRAAAEGARVGDRFAIGYTMHTESVLYDRKRDMDKYLACIDRALDVIGDDPQTADLRALLLSNRMFVLGCLDRVTEADVARHEARVFAERIGTARIGSAISRWPAPSISTSVDGGMTPRPNWSRSPRCPRHSSRRCGAMGWPL
jgi:tetratricopeptide (TPR) repeat protein